ncbi:hypothetical protein FAF44_02865 [Nonomuraea sp. MG754425]|uniref:hypothetical protein n=1 Tax=Nonomuraea sp. MG754425 TaxID=2570319 RepID=UPI001F487757|nr:hypothetical protein [Nonomuraea sp. MG754425]MCF6467356.1 hypothetical protein [Nonomuraea sp. MG754425]
MAEIPQEAVQDLCCHVINEFSRRRCTDDPAVRLTAGCVHEHVGSIVVCQHHAEGLATGEVGCWQCVEVDGHFCASAIIGKEPIHG